MNATKKLAAAIILLVAASAFSITALVKERKSPVLANNGKNEILVLYYGNTCPHCKIVEEWLKNYDPFNRIGVVLKEVYQNQDNRKEFIEKATICKLDLNNLGVPMLWEAENSKCYEGDQPITDFLNTKLLKE